jgi:hypothetical protein
MTASGEMTAAEAGQGAGTPGTPRCFHHGTREQSLTAGSTAGLLLPNCTRPVLSQRDRCRWLEHSGELVPVV